MLVLRCGVVSGRRNASSHNAAEPKQQPAQERYPRNGYAERQQNQGGRKIVSRRAGHRAVQRGLPDVLAKSPGLSTGASRQFLSTENPRLSGLPWPEVGSRGWWGSGFDRMLVGAAF